jgi:preprotein translocase subunit SecG
VGRVLRRIHAAEARMSTLLHVIHIVSCLFLILVVLLQQGKGGGLGGLGGGATQVFGGRGAGNFMTRLTAACATIFIFTSIALAWLSSSGDRELKKYQQSQQEK